jgi:hypothetical protein
VLNTNKQEIKYHTKMIALALCALFGLMLLISGLLVNQDKPLGWMSFGDIAIILFGLALLIGTGYKMKTIQKLNVKKPSVVKVLLIGAEFLFGIILFVVIIGIFNGIVNIIPILFVIILFTLNTFILIYFNKIKEILKIN